MNTNQSVLLKSLQIVKPNFHAFTARFHRKLAESGIVMNYPTANQFNEKSYTFYCVLERIIKHLDNPSSVTPFLTHYLEHLNKRNIQQTDIKILCDIFYATLEAHLGQHFCLQSQTAWQEFLTFFENCTNSSLFNISNVISLQQRISKTKNNTN
ncbi:MULTISPECIES: globin [Pseudoalteromonas]|uniref:Globin n=1 Tax=Pseudoalteromonas fuliginea TaxID=1872678 RepID=A0A063KVI9_9GAMM|nr:MULTISPECIES: globin [Pseudoalteromonas]ALQ08785.1 hemoglobin [Pseudoalteromonas sp. Bsw20308]KAA1154371.1 globin [Pseudoalteromonas fuliginea]KAA1164841.1 globin [Pseudoalteromonas fuliginea]KAA1166971.1 globin [Pseudoalteromonas fuliginea]KDC52860.1 hemoglobin [Pseudoalteromonas fuliginea]